MKLFCWETVRWTLDQSINLSQSTQRKAITSINQRNPTTIRSNFFGKMLRFVFMMKGFECCRCRRECQEPNGAQTHTRFHQAARQFLYDPTDYRGSLPFAPNGLGVDAVFFQECEGHVCYQCQIVRRWRTALKHTSREMHACRSNESFWNTIYRSKYENS